MADRLDISQRKKDHIALCAGDGVNFRGKGTLLDQVELVHNAMPELHLDEIDAGIGGEGHDERQRLLGAKRRGARGRRVERDA